MSYKLKDLTERYYSIFTSKSDKTSEKLEMFLAKENNKILENQNEFSKFEHKEMNSALLAITNMRMHLLVSKKKDFIEMLLEKFEHDINKKNSISNNQFTNKAFGAIVNMNDFFMKMLTPDGPYSNPKIKPAASRSFSLNT